MIKEKLGNIVSFQRGYDLTHGQMKGGNIPVVGSSEVIGWHNVTKSEAPTLLIGRSGTVGRPQYYDCAVWPHNTTLFVTDFHDNNPKYCYYLLRNLNLEDYASSSGVPTLNRNFIEPLQVKYHKREEQDKIVKVLTALDDKISTNNKIIETSEKLMREIYDYWFVQFDFPDENGRPYKSSGGEMVYNETLKREIPKEWNDKKLQELVQNRTESVIGSHSDKCIDLSIMPSSSLSLDKYNYGDSFGSNMKKMCKGDILFGSIRPYLRKAGIAPYDGVRAGTVHCFYAKNDNDKSLCSVLLTSEDMFQYAIQKSGGSTRMPSISAKDLMNYSLAYDESVVCRFNELCLPIIDKILMSINENIALASLRDWLLPMLMNGQIVVDE